MEEGVASSTWKLILTDCYNAGSKTTVTLKSGREFTGYVSKHPSKYLNNVIQMGAIHGNIVFNMDVSEIAAITEMR